MSILTPLPLEDARRLPLWQRPEALLILLSIAMPLSFSVWSAVLQNFVIERAGFDGQDWGWLQSVREVPGFLGVGVIVLLLVIREQPLAILSLIMLGAAIAVTAAFPSFGGLLLTTLIGSFGFHYFETVNQSMQLQWLEKARAPQVLGWTIAAGSGASLLVYVLLLGWERFGMTYGGVLAVGGVATILLAVVAAVFYPRIVAPVRQHPGLVLRRRYWLYYVLEFMGGARRQIFVVFAAFMMVERFGFEVHELTGLFLINYIMNIVVAPMVGRAIAGFGERIAMLVEYSGLTFVFLAYAGVYWFGWSWELAAALYVIDHFFFSFRLANKTYFQKIADPADIAPTAAVSFTINHVAAVFLPAALGALWLVSPGAVFGLAAAFAIASFALALLIPRHPEPGRETLLGGAAAGAPAE